MPSIGIVDDRADIRGTLKTFLERFFTGWEVIAIAPPDHKDECVPWIVEEDISLLLLDERLQEVKNGRKQASYEGHELVDAIRQSLPTLPIFVVTGYPGDEDIRSRFKDVEGIIDRTEFYRMAEGYLPRIRRAAQQYVKSHAAELELLSVGAKKTALGTATRQDIRNLRAVQMKIALGFPIAVIQERQQLLKELEEELERLEALCKRKRAR